MTEEEKKNLLFLLEKAWNEDVIVIACGGESGSPTNIEFDKNGILQIYST